RYEEEGTKPITVTITHDSAPAAMAFSTAFVADQPGVPTGGFTFSAVEGAPSASQTVATFTDPAGAESLNDYSASISWGDGSASPGTITVNAGVFTVSGNHSYAEEGSKTITVTVNHDTALAATTTSTASVADQP